MFGLDLGLHFGVPIAIGLRIRLHLGLRLHGRIYCGSHSRYRIFLFNNLDNLYFDLDFGHLIICNLIFDILILDFGF